MEEVTFVLPRSGTTLHGLRSGRGLPVLCLHGWLDNCASYLPLMQRVADLDLIAIDLPGHGRSDPGPGAFYDLPSYAACVLELAHSQGWDRFGLVGHSMGGVVAAVTAGLQPEKVLRLVLIDIIGLFTASPEQTRARLSGYLEAYLRDEPVRGYATRDAAVRARAQLADMAHETAELLSGRDLVAGPDGLVWRTDPRLKYPFPLTFDEAQMHALLGNISAPTLRVNAQRTPPKPSLCHGVTDVLRDVRSVTLHGGHHLHMENADPVAAEIRRFLRAAVPV